MKREDGGRFTPNMHLYDSVDFGAGILPAHNFSIADPYFTHIPPVTAYYRTFGIAGAPVEVFAGGTAWNLQNPSWPTGADILAEKGLLDPDTGEYEFWDQLNPVGGVGDGAFVKDANLTAIRASLTGTVHVFKIPSDFFKPHTTPVVRSQGTLTITEPLLAFQGMSPFKPFAIYPTIPRFPAFLQNFSYHILQRDQNDVVIQADDILEYFNEIAVPTLSPSGEFTVTMHSANTFSQQDKELETINMPWPRFEIFQSNLAHDGVAKVHCETTSGVPEYIFLRLDRVNSRQAILTNQPVINTLKFSVLNQDVKTVSDLDKNQLYHTTRRNSHINALCKENLKAIGAVLLHRTDIGNLSEFDELKGNISLDIEVTDFDLFHPDVHAPYAITHEPDPLIFKVCFIYPNFALHGRENEAQFWFT